MKRWYSMIFALRGVGGNQRRRVCAEKTDKEYIGEGETWPGAERRECECRRWCLHLQVKLCSPIPSYLVQVA